MLPHDHTGPPLPSLAAVYVLGGMMNGLRRSDDDDTFELVSHSETDKIRMLFLFVLDDDLLICTFEQTLSCRSRVRVMIKSRHLLVPCCADGALMTL